MPNEPRKSRSLPLLLPHPTPLHSLPTHHTTTPPPGTTVQGVATPVCDPVSVVCSAGAMCGARDDGEGAARRRRERHLRLWLKHERQSVAMALSEYNHHSQEDRGRTGLERRSTGTKYVAPRRQKSLLPWVPGHPLWVSRGGHRNGSSSAPWSSSPTSCPWSRFWIFLCRRWWNSCRTLCALLFLIRSWRNSWWKCRRSYPSPCCS